MKRDVTVKKSRGRSGRAPRESGFFSMDRWTEGQFSVGILVGTIVLGGLIAAGLRMVEIPLWSSPHLHFANEPILSEADSYAWLAGAEGLNQHAHHPLAWILRFLHQWTGLPLGMIGFWLPVFCAPLVILPLAFLCWRWLIPEAGLVAGILAGCSLGFYDRTRLGILDTDILTLFFPACIAVGYAFLIEPALKTGGEEEIPEGEGAPSVHAAVMALFTGGLIRAYRGFYLSANPLIYALTGMSLLLVCIRGRAGHRGFGVITVMISFLCGVGPWGVALVAAATLIPCVRLRGNPRSGRIRLAVMLFLVVLILFHGGLESITDQVRWHLFRYFSPEVSGVNALPDHAPEPVRLVFPPVTNSVREAARIPWNQALDLATVYPAVTIACLAGWLYLLRFRPALLLFLPLLGLGLLTPLMGQRFAMYAGPAAGLGLAGGVATWAKRRGIGHSSRLGIQLAMAVLLTGLICFRVQGQSVPRFIPKVTVEAMAELQTVTRPGSLLWMWWDQGYVLQYFSRRATLVDGSRNSGAELIPLARVSATSSVEDAWRIMIAGAAGQVEPGAAEGRSRSAAPFQTLYRSSPADVAGFFRNPSQRPLPALGDLGDQYLVLTWENLKLVDWIYFYGSWDLIRGGGSMHHSQLFQGAVDLNLATGAVSADGQKFNLQRLTVLGRTERRDYRWPDSAGLCGVRNEMLGTLLVTDASIRDSMMVRMLIEEPDRFSPRFHLVYERYPWIRVYRMEPGTAPGE